MLRACVIPFIFDESNAALTLLWGMSDRMQHPQPRRLRGKKRRRKSLTQSLWIWLKVTCTFSTDGLFDLMRLNPPHPSPLWACSPSLRKVRRIEGVLSFCYLEDDPQLFQEHQSQGLLSVSPSGLVGVTMCVPLRTTKYRGQPDVTSDHQITLCVCFY